VLWAKTPAGHGEIGSQLALSATGGHVAFLPALVPVELPSAYLHVGNLEVWNVSKKAGGKRLATVLDEGLAWFPDGRRLAFVRLLAGPKPLLTVSFIRTDSGERQAVVRAVDPRTVVSIGAGSGGSE
jgi:hypothetical protein